MPRPERRDYYFEPTSTSGYSSPDRYRDPLAAPPAPAPPPPLPPKQPWYRGAPALIAAGKHVGHHDFERACVSVAVEQPARAPSRRSHNGATGVVTETAPVTTDPGVPPVTVTDTPTLTPTPTPSATDTATPTISPPETSTVTQTQTQTVTVEPTRDPFFPRHTDQ
jgi:hypothetical protein